VLAATRRTRQAEVAKEVNEQKLGRQGERRYKGVVSFCGKAGTLP
jgi:hypothetical protein